jgi:hypothetical protein
LGFHPHIHCLVPGAGLNDCGRFVRVKQPNNRLTSFAWSTCRRPSGSICALSSTPTTGRSIPASGA